MPLPLQVKLLRVLQERTFERVGETQSRPFCARVIAATHQDLHALVRQRQFRDDLYYRLNVVPLRLPPLRARREDLVPLVRHLLERIGRRRSRSLRLAPTATRTLMVYDWPGNVRQLENALEYATAVCEGQTIHREDLPAEITAGRATPGEEAIGTAPQAAGSTGTPVVPAPSADDRATGSDNRFPSAEQIREALAATQFRRARAAELLGVSRTTLWRRMRELGI